MDVETDPEGFLRQLSDWNKAVAGELAAVEEIELNANHWEIIDLARAYYDKHKIFPISRVLVKKMKEGLGASKGTSIHLMKLFGGKPIKVIAKIAGLPKPANCD